MSRTVNATCEAPWIDGIARFWQYSGAWTPPADRSGAPHGLPRRDLEPLRVELLVERQMVGGEPRQLVGGLDGVRIATLALLEAGAGADVRVPACRPPPLGPFAGLPRERLWDERQLDRCAVRRHRRLGPCHQVVGVDDHRAV